MSQTRLKILVNALPLAAVLALTGCGPAADTIPSAQAQPAAVSTIAYPQIAEDAEHDTAYEYH
jgi:hypothetical protein